MSIKEANVIMEEYGLSMGENSIEIVLEVINKYGSARNVLLEGLKPKYQYLKKLSKLLAMLDEPQSFDLEAEKIAILLHDIHKVILLDAQKKGENFLTLLKAINVRKTFNPTPMELWVMQYLGGRELIADINLQDANQLNRRIRSAIEKYKQNPELGSDLIIQNSTLENVKLKR